MTVAENVALGREAAWRGQTPCVSMSAADASRLRYGEPPTKALGLCGIPDLADRVVGTLRLDSVSSSVRRCPVERCSDDTVGQVGDSA